MRAILVGLAIVSSGCFPDSARHRRIAKISEGGAILTGITLNLVAAKTACMERRPGAIGDDSCGNGGLDSIGLVLIFAGLVGFAATTISGMEDGPETTVSEDPGPFRVRAPPASFCAAIWANDLDRAELALTGYLGSIGATERRDARDALQAWLSRQPCVTVEIEDEGILGVRVVGREARYTIDVSNPFAIFMHEPDDGPPDVH